MANLRDIMAKDVRTCSTNDSLEKVAQIMKSENVGAVPIVEGDKVVGIVTDRDLVIRGIAENNLGSATVKQIMSQGLITGTPDMNVEAAAELMSKNEIRRLPIVENEKLVGIVALGDLAARDQYSNMAGEALKEISESEKTLH